jgi:RimJ/RimL family protein N-acetyltransferase
MSLVVVAAPESHFGWLSERIGGQFTSAFRAIEAVDSATGQVVGMVGYDNWTKNSVQIHVALDSPLALRALVLRHDAPAFAYPFLQAGMGVLIGSVSSKNTRALALNKRLGFRQTHVIADGFAPGEDIILMEMRKEECRWLPAQRRRAG